MPKRIPSAQLSREDRKNEHVLKMFERQEKQRQKREEKKRLGVPGTRERKPMNGGDDRRVDGRRRVVPQNPHRRQVVGPSHGHHFHRSGVSKDKGGKNHPSVQIHVIFANQVRQQNTSNRYFFERKQTIEEKQRSEYDHEWAKLAHRHHYAQQMASMVHGHAGGTGDHYEGNEDYSVSSDYYSSASKRQRTSEEGGYLPSKQLYLTHSAALPARQSSGQAYLHQRPTSAMQHDVAGPDARNPSSVTEESVSAENSQQISKQRPDGIANGREAPVSITVSGSANSSGVAQGAGGRGLGLPMAEEEKKKIIEMTKQATKQFKQSQFASSQQQRESYLYPPQGASAVDFSQDQQHQYQAQANSNFYQQHQNNLYQANGFGFGLGLGLGFGHPFLQPNHAGFNPAGHGMGQSAFEPSSAAAAAAILNEQIHNNFQQEQDKQRL